MLALKKRSDNTRYYTLEGDGELIYIFTAEELTWLADEITQIELEESVEDDR